jgi:Raf kinase inhibitor-like YbhB/YbcL family protein
MQRLTLAIAAGALLFAGHAFAADPFTLTSSTFKDGTPMAAKNGGNNKANPNCNGENVSPPLAWSNVPADTKSFALIVIDPEGQRGLGSVHAVAYGIPASVNGFAEGDLTKPSDKYVIGKVGAGITAYAGPCTAPNTGYHHYVFVLIASDLDPKELPAGLTRDELLAKLKGHAKGAAGLVGLLRKP